MKATVSIEMSQILKELNIQGHKATRRNVEAVVKQLKEMLQNFATDNDTFEDAVSYVFD